MQGQVTNIDGRSRRATVRGDDNRTYTLSFDNLPRGARLNRNDQLEFDPNGNEADNIRNVRAGGRQGQREQGTTQLEWTLGKAFGFTEQGSGNKKLRIPVFLKIKNGRYPLAGAPVTMYRITESDNDLGYLSDTQPPHAGRRKSKLYRRNS